MGTVPGAPGSEPTATVSVEGRLCSARAAEGSGVGSASGPVVVADSAQALRRAGGWMPGRILVLTAQGLGDRDLDSLLHDVPTRGFAALVLLVDVGQSPALPPDRAAALPVVLVSRPPDQECVRRALRIAVEVVESDRTTPDLPHPRRPRRRHSWLPWHAPNGTHRVPGTTGMRRR